MRILGSNNRSRIGFLPLPSFLNDIPMNGVILNIVIIAGLTLFPFDFSLPNRSFTNLAQVYLFRWGGLSDLLNVVVNVLLFVPLGFCLAWLPRIRTSGNLNPWLSICGLGFLLSLTIETLQLFLPSRYVSVIDILANSAGSVAGLLLFRGFGPDILARLYVLFQQIRAHFNPWITSTGLAGYFIIMICLSVSLQQSSGLSNWYEESTLTINNQTNGGRNWRGIVSSILISDKALAQENFHQTENDKIEFPWLCIYRLEDDTRYQDQSGNLPDLYRHSEPPQRGRNTDPESGLNDLVRAIKSSSRFTLRVGLQTADPDQEGPADILKISNDAGSPNLVLAQDNQDLVIRMRTSLVGTNKPEAELVLQDIFTNRDRKNLTLTFDGERLVAYDGRTQLAPVLRLSPGAALFSFFFGGEASDLHGFHIIYYGVMFAPLGGLFILFVRQVQPDAYVLPIIAVFSIFVISCLLEYSLAQIGSRPFYEDNLFLAILFSLSPIPLLSSWSIDDSVRTPRRHERLC